MISVPIISHSLSKSGNILLAYVAGKFDFLPAINERSGKKGGGDTFQKIVFKM